MLLNAKELTADKIMDWLTQLEAIGAAIAELSFQNSEVLTHHGQGLGNAISEYSRSIYFVVNGCYQPLTRFLESGGLTPAGELNYELERFSKKKITPDDIDRINKGLEKTEIALSDSLPLHDIRKKLLMLREVAKGSGKDQNGWRKNESSIGAAGRGPNEKEITDIIDEGEDMAFHYTAVNH